MELCYKEFVEKVKECPPSHFKGLDCISFRWVFDSIDNEENFIPPGIKNPKRLNEKKNDYCSLLAISFFNSEAKARQRFNILKEQIGGNISVTLGTKIAQGHLINEDGVGEDASSSGHFDFHPEKNYNFNKKFKILSTL